MSEGVCTGPDCHFLLLAEFVTKTVHLNPPEDWNF
jgi:hypothetical protein